MSNPWNLTARETEVLTLVADLGCSKLASRAAAISSKTVDIHMTNVIAKMGARNRLQAAVKWDRWAGRMPLPEIDERERERINGALLYRLQLVRTKAAA
jgi:DNA-binding CsgD family transcriptional regulator